MSMSEPLTVRMYPDPALSRRCNPATHFDAELAALAHGMLDAMRGASGVGLAANQVGVATRMFVMSGEITNGVDRVFVNPEIALRSGICELEEGCLSLPGLRYRVEGRAAIVTVRYQSLDGGRHEEDFQGMAALCAQHEIDHLDGLTMIERLSPLKASRAKAKLSKAKNMRG